MAGPLPYPINRQHDGVRFARAALLTELACLTFLLSSHFFLGSPLYTLFHSSYT